MTGHFKSLRKIVIYKYIYIFFFLRIQQYLVMRMDSVLPAHDIGSLVKEFLQLTVV